MALPIRDGNQSPTTLSTIIVNNAHIPAHTVVSLGTQAITDIATAVSGVELGPNTLNALENITVTLGQVTITGGLTDAQLRASAVTIGGSVTATISGTPSVTFGTAVITGSASILNFPATQTVTFGTAVITGSTSIIGTPSVTFTQASVTFGQSTITGSVSVLNLPATQTVTFTTAPVTFGTSVITGSASILNFPATQTVTFTQASVTFGQAIVSASNIAGLNNSVGNDGSTPASTNFIKIGGHQDGSNSVEHIVHVSAGGAMKVDASDSTVTFGAVTGSVSILNFPATQTVTFSQAPVTFGLISGTVTANPTGTQTIAGTVTANINTFPDATTIGEQIAQGFTNYGSFDVAISGTANVSGTVTIGAGTAQIGSVTASISNSLTISSLPAIGGTVTATGFDSANGISKTIPVVRCDDGIAFNSDAVPVAIAIESGSVNTANPLPISGTVTANLGSALPTGSNRIGVVTIGAGTVTIGAGTAEIGTVKPAKTQSGNAQFLAVDDGSGKLFTSTLLTAGTAQIGSVTASISGTVPISISSVTVGNSVTIGSLPLIAGTVTANVGAVDQFALKSALDEYALNYNDAWPIKYANTHEGDPFPISGTVTANTFALQGTAVTTSNFTSTTASTVLAGYNATREVLTIFNEGAGNLHICAGATCTTIAYQVRLSAGDYYEVPNHQTTITHSAVFATAGTARVTQVS